MIPVVWFTGARLSKTLEQAKYTWTKHKYDIVVVAPEVYVDEHEQEKVAVASGRLINELSARHTSSNIGQVEAIYTRFARHKLGKVDGLLLKYAGNEDKLLRLVRRKYVDAGKQWQCYRIQMKDAG